MKNPANSLPGPVYTRPMLHSRSGLRIALLSAFLPLFSCYAIGQSAARPAPLRQLPQTSHFIPSVPQAAHAAGRFLGWNYAKRAHQDIRAWQRHAGSPISSGATAEYSSPSLFAPSRRTRPLVGPGSTTGLQPGFVSAERLPSGTLPTALVSGDFNEDGKPDLAISNGGDNTVTVLLGDGAGGFVNPPGLLYTTGSTPVWLTAAKLTSSGHIDIIAVDADSNQVEVFRGNGNGTFQAPYTLDSLNQIPTYVIAGDFNKDGHTDLAIGLTIDPLGNEPPFVTLLGDGSGAFPTKIYAAPFANPSDVSPLPVDSLVAGDLNKDGFPDVAVVFTGGGVTYLNQGGTSFPAGTVFNSVDGLIGLALADTDGDGCLDAVEAGTYGLLSIAKGGCDGTFNQGNVIAAVGDQDPAVLVTDVDGDGVLDIVASAAFFELGASGSGYGAPGGYTISVFKGTAGGSFAPASIYRGAGNQYSLAAVDLSGSGTPDLIAVAQLDSAAIRLANDGKGNFGTESGEAVGYLNGIVNAPSPVSSPQVVDLNGDGRPDVLLVESGELSSQPSQLTSLLNDGSGKLQPPVRSPITSAGNPLYPIFTAANFRTPSSADAVLISSYVNPTVAYYPGDGHGSFGAPTVLGTLPNPLIVQSGDVNHDGKADFVVYGTTSDATSDAEIDVYLGNGDGTFKHLPAQVSPALLNLGFIYPQQLFIADFNHDGKPDLLIGFNTNNGWTFTGDDLELALGNGDGTFQNPQTIMPAFGPVAVGDLNHDGYLDLVQVHDPGQSITAQAVDGQGSYVAPAATVYVGQANGQFTKGASYLAPQIQYPSYSPALMGDFDGDGNLDVAIPYGAAYGRPWSFQLLVLGGAGDGTFRPSGIPYQLPIYDKPVIGGDFRGTGHTDLLDLIGATSSINILPAGSPATVSVSFDALPLPAIGGTVTVSLAAPAAAGETVTLTATDPAVQVPSSVTFQAGEIEQSVTYKIGAGFDTHHMLAVTASLNGYAASAYGALPNGNRQASVRATIGILNAGTTVAAGVSPGDSTDLVFTMYSVNGYSGNFSGLTCTGLPPGSTCTFVASHLALLAGGSTDTAFQISTSPGTPLGIYPVQITANNGSITASATVTFGVGAFTLSASPTTIPINDGIQPPYTTLTANYQDGYPKTLDVTCAGLPTGSNCYFAGALYPANNTAQLSVSESGLAPADYPFTIIASGGALIRSIPAILRVENYTASLGQTTLTAASGKPVNVAVSFNSVNHFTTSSIQISCQSSASIACNAKPYNAVLTDGGTTTVQLAITGTYSALGRNRAPALWRHATLPLLATVMLPFAIGKRRHSRVLLCLCIFCTCAFMGACGGGSSGSSGAGGSSKGQKIVVQVSATAQTASNGPLIQNVGTVTLTLTE